MRRLSDGDETAEFANVPFVTELRSAEALSNRLGAAVQPRRIRVKPGRSAIVSWQRQGEERLDGYAEWGWTAIVRDEDKLANLHRRAARRGERLIVHEASEPRSAGATGSVLLSGSVLSDAKVGKEIVHADSHLCGGGCAGADSEHDLEVIRYNPGRRILLKRTPEGSRTPEFVRIGAHSCQHLVDTAAQWAEWNLPTLPVEFIGGRPTAVRSPWWGFGDLETHPDRSRAADAGTIIAELHRHTPAEVVRPVRVSPLEQASSAAAVLTRLLPRTSKQLEEILPRLRDRIETDPGRGGACAGDEHRAIHGDLSPDQVLVGNSECRIIDLDRAGVGPIGMDLGRWIAACRTRRAPGPPETEVGHSDTEVGHSDTEVGAGSVSPTALEAGFLDGYFRAGGADVDLEAWTAWALLVTAIEPWRNCRPGWQEQTMQIIDRAHSGAHGRPA